MTFFHCFALDFFQILKMILVKIFEFRQNTQLLCRLANHFMRIRCIQF